MCQFTFVCASDRACSVRPSILSGARSPNPGLVSCVWFGYSTIPNLQCKRDQPNRSAVGGRAGISRGYGVSGPPIDRAVVLHSK